MKRFYIFPWVIIILLFSSFFVYKWYTEKEIESYYFTQDDMAWASDSMVFKIDLHGHENVNGLRIAVYTSNHEFIAKAGQIMSKKPMGLHSNNRYAFVTINKTSNQIEGKLRNGMISTNYQLKVNSNGNWSWSTSGPLQFENDKYYLAELLNNKEPSSVAGDSSERTLSVVLELTKGINLSESEILSEK